MTDKEFTSAIKQLLKGDKDGLRLIYEAYVKLIYSVVYDTVGSKEDAEDITSDFFIKLIRVADTYKKGSPHKTWLVTIAKNMAIDHIRKRSREVLEIDNSNEDDDNAPRQWADQSAASVEDSVSLKSDMAQAMATLNPREREVVDLKLVGQFKFKEIAEMLNQPMGTVTWLYNQGIQKLRRCLVDYAGE
ncbi:MAG: RNA polymerase sigma factor [Lachnospiraceae bacterium]|nr:RNA polymerase sigma factor [Lachnospiraceae bacterium]